MLKMYYNFPTIKGNQAYDEYYICMVPLGILNKIFLNTDSEVLPEFRAQRKLNESRVPVIKDYILNNRDSYVFSALAASIDGDIKFKPSENNSEIGVLEIDMKAKILINDGQHRKAAIISALEEDSSLENETIAVVFYKDKGLIKSQQMFTDLNKHAVTTSKSLNALYDSKDIYSIISKEVLINVPFLNKYTDKEKDNLGKFSQMLFTLNNFVNANKKVIKNMANSNKTNEEIKRFLIEFWNSVCENILEWNLLECKDLSKKSLREDFIITQGVSFLALGLLADFFASNPGINMKQHLFRLRNIDWARNNLRTWSGSAIKSNGKINRNTSGINLTYLTIKHLVDLPLNQTEKNTLERRKA